jgi:hypothetical protein
MNYSSKTIHKTPESVRPTSFLDRKLVELEERIDALEKKFEPIPNEEYFMESKPTKTIELTDEELEWLRNVATSIKIEHEFLIEKNITTISIKQLKKDHSIAQSILSKLNKQDGK